MKCRAFDPTVVGDLCVLPSKSLLWAGFQKCGTILSYVFDFYNFARTAAAVVKKCTLILNFPKAESSSIDIAGNLLCLLN